MEEPIKVYIEYTENGLTLNNEFYINKIYERYFNDYDKNKFFKEKELINVNFNNIDKSNYFITKILKWCHNNENLFSIEPNLKIIKINFYNKDNLNDTYIKYSVVKNDFLNNYFYNIIHLSYKFKYNNILYNDDIALIINTVYGHNSLSHFINSILTHISYTEYNKKYNKEYLKIEHLDKTKEELNKLIENYNSGIKNFITNYDKNYKEIVENNKHFKVVLNQDLNQRFETIENKIKKVSESAERNNDKIMLLVDKTLREKLINIPKTEDVKQTLDNLSELPNIHNFKKEITSKISSIKTNLNEHKNLINQNKKEIDTSIIKLKDEYSKLTDNLNDHYKELIKTYNNDFNKQIQSYQKSINSLSTMNKTFMFLIIVYYYIFLYLIYFY